MPVYGYRSYDSSVLPKKLNPNMSWKVITDPTVEPITVPELKAFARIDGDYENDLLASIIKSARQCVEDYTNRAIITQTIELVMDFWPAVILELPRPPLISISSIKTLDESNVETVYDSANYFTVTNCEPGKLIIKNSVTPPYNTTRFYGGYKVTYLAGYGSTASYVPEQLKTACKLWAAAIYENRTLPADPDKLIKDTLDTFKVFSL